MTVEPFVTAIHALADASLLVSGSGRLIAANAAASRLLNVARKPDDTLLHSLVSTDAQELDAYLRQCSRSREVVLGGLRMITGDGEEKLSVKGALLEARADNREALILLQLQPRLEANQRFTALKERVDELNSEISRRLKVEQDLRSQKEWLQVTLASIGDAVITTDQHGRISFMNPIAEQLTGWSNAEAQDKPLDEIFVIIDEGNGKPVANPAGKVLAENRIVNLAEHAVLVSRDRRQIPIADTAAPIRLSEELAGVVLVFQDVSLKRNLQRQLFERAEKLEEANRRKNTFLAMLAHELRNPLAPISNAIQLLKLDPGLLTEVQQILDRQTGHLNRLLNDLLDVSRITQGKVTVNREMIDIASLIRLECSDNQSRFEQLGIDLQVQVPDHKVLVMADTTRLTQVIGNLLNNAQKFTPSGGWVAVKLDLGEDTVWLTVTDSGAGIDHATMADLFQPFTQGDQSLDRKQGGLGLGLALVKGIIDLHGGNVFAESEGPEQGAKFTIVLPLAQPVEVQILPEQKKQSSRKNILLIEDNPDQAESMRMLLELLGSDVHVAIDGIQGVERATELNPDVIICDIGLPGIDGFEVAQTLRARQLTASTLMIALTGYGQNDFVERARAAGFDQHFLKPMSLKDIEAVISAPEPSA